MRRTRHADLTGAAQNRIRNHAEDTGGTSHRGQQAQEERLELWLRERGCHEFRIV